jgi:hypothetical protein
MAAWLLEAKHGTFRAMAHVRRKLLAPGEMTVDDRRAAADLLGLLEEFLNDHVKWRGMQHMTQRAMNHVRGRDE